MKYVSLSRRHPRLLPLLAFLQFPDTSSVSMPNFVDWLLSDSLHSVLPDTCLNKQILRDFREWVVRANGDISRARYRPGCVEFFPRSERTGQALTKIEKAIVARNLSMHEEAERMLRALWTVDRLNPGNGIFHWMPIPDYGSELRDVLKTSVNPRLFLEHCFNTFLEVSSRLDILLRSLNWSARLESPRAATLIGRWVRLKLKVLRNLAGGRAATMNWESNSKLQRKRALEVTKLQLRSRITHIPF